MPKKRETMMTVKITGPNCRILDRLYMPGETALVPSALAQDWIDQQRAVEMTAEVTNGDGSDSQ